ncbi:AAA ATPase domain-containing protein, partial [Jimgerdemannia flammicorona]
EQTGRTSYYPDHRTDLYSLGIVFFTLLTRKLPFEGGPMDIIHSVLSRKVPLVHEVRPDVPSIISLIIEKLTSKVSNICMEAGWSIDVSPPYSDGVRCFVVRQFNDIYCLFLGHVLFGVDIKSREHGLCRCMPWRISPDDRYNSANGLLKDLLECQRRLTQSSDSSEPIAHFPLGQLDVASLFTLPSTIFGRQNEIEQITSIIKRVADTHAQFSKGGSSGSETAISTAFVKNGTSVVKEKNGCEFIVVCGPGGIGKSTLVNLIQTTARESGYMAASKFDSKQQIPYSPILRCVSTILKQLLTESEDEIHRFYTRLRDNLGPQFVNVQLMIDLVPELKPILANMPSLPALEQLSSGENVARFHSVFLEVIRSIAQRRMLTLFLDDLQQADESSLDLIASLVAAKIKMIIIVTFRDKEVSREKMASIFDSEYARVTYIKLEPLDITSLTEFVVATLHRDKDTVLPMVELIQRRTRGNPLYARQLILCMKKRDIIYFDRENKKWEYDLGAMKEMLGPDGGGGGGTVDEADVDVDFLVDHLRELPLDAQKFLKWASLIGKLAFPFLLGILLVFKSGWTLESIARYKRSQFHAIILRFITGNVFDLKSIKYLMSLTDLDQSDLTNVDNVKQGIDGIQLTMLEESLFSSQPVSIRKRDEVHHQGKDVVIGLQILLQEGILLPIVEDEFRFMHDRYLHAAYLLADETLRQKMHLKIAEFLMQDASAEVFLIADHLIKSACLIAAFPQKSKYRAILGRAGDKASSSGALKMALSYYSCCLDLLTASPWKFGLDSSYIETLQLYLKVAELARWSNDTARAISLLKDVFSHAESPVDRTPAWRIRSQMHYLQQNYRDGLHDLFQCLRELGLQGIRLDITQDEVDELFYQLKGDIVRRGFNGLCDTPPCEDPRILSIMGVLQEAATVSYWHSPQLVDMMAMRLVQTSLVYGMSSASGPGFAWFGGAAANRYELYSFAADLGELVVALCEKYSGHSEIARGYIAYALLLHQWKNRHIRTGMTFFEKAYKHALSGGDNVYSASALLHIGVIKFYIGENLDDTVEQLQRGLDESRETSSNTISLLFTGMIRTILALQGKTYATADAIFDDEFFREEDYVEESCKNTTDTLIPMSWYWSFKIVPLVLYGYYEKAAELGFDCIKGLDCHP